MKKGFRRRSEKSILGWNGIKEKRKDKNILKRRRKKYEKRNETKSSDSIKEGKRELCD